MRKNILMTLAVAGVATFGLSACASTEGTGTTTEPQAGTNAPAETPVPAPAVPEKPAAPKMTIAQENAVGSAESYLDYAGFSRSGLIKQLEFEDFDTATATFAVDHDAPDYNAEAVESAQSYMDYSSFSRQGLVDQLTFEGFTPEQAEFGVTAVYGAV